MYLFCLIYENDEVKEFNQLFFNKADAEELSPFIDNVVSKFDQELSEEEKADFKIKAKQFVNFTFLAEIVPSYPTQI